MAIAERLRHFCHSLPLYEYIVCLPRPTTTIGICLLRFKHLPPILRARMGKDGQGWAGEVVPELWVHIKHFSILARSHLSRQRQFRFSTSAHSFHQSLSSYTYYILLTITFTLSTTIRTIDPFPHNNYPLL